MTILTEYLERGRPALRVTLELPPRLKIRVAPPAGPAAAQQPAANADDGEPT